MQLRFLDVATGLPDSGIVVCIGRRKSGKTVNILDILYHKRMSFSHGIVFCGSKATCREYQQHIPSVFIHDEFNPKLLESIVNKQERDVEMGTAKPIFVLLDDLMYAKGAVTRDKTVRRIAFNGRHAKIFLILSMQYSMDLDPSIRQQIDFVFLSREKNKHYREKLYNAYNVCFESPSAFDRAMTSCTNDFETFVLSSASDTQSDKPEDNAFWFKSKPGRKFKMNAKGSWWKFHRRMYDPKHFLRNDGGDQATVTLVSAPKRAPQISHTEEGKKHIATERLRNVGPRSGIGTGLRDVL